MGRISKALLFDNGFMERQEIGCQMFNKRVSWQAMAKDKYYSSASKIDNYGTIERKSGKHNNDVIMISRIIAVNK